MKNGFSKKSCSPFDANFSFQQQKKKRSENYIKVSGEIQNYVA
jgi:hypothetical protein